MNERIFKLRDLSPTDRIAILEAESAGKEEIQYQKPLNLVEMDVMRHDLVETMIRKGFLDDELAKIKKDFKDKIEPLSELISETIEALKIKSAEKKGIVYKMISYEERHVYFLDTEGNIISSRMMLPEERAMHITFGSQESKVV
jgi:hypothetical protein